MYDFRSKREYKIFLQKVAILIDNKQLATIIMHKMTKNFAWVEFSAIKNYILRNIADQIPF